MTSNPLPTVQVQVDIPKKEIHKRLFSKRLEELDEGKTGTNQRGKISSQLNCDVDDADCDDDDADCDDDDADCDDDDEIPKKYRFFLNDAPPQLVCLKKKVLSKLS